MAEPLRETQRDTLRMPSLDELRKGGSPRPAVPVTPPSRPGPKQGELPVSPSPAPATSAEEPAAAAERSYPDLPPAPAAQPGGSVSAAPRRAVGTRSRAGNAMARTRAGLLDGALRAVAAQGARKTTMNDIAAQAGVAKATLYNHFRAKDDVWTALILAEIEDLAEECRELPLADGLAAAALRIGGHPALRHVAETEPLVLAALLTAEDSPGWRAARTAVRDRLAAAGVAEPADDLVLRWLASHLARAADPVVAAAGARAVAAAIAAG